MKMKKNELLEIPTEYLVTALLDSVSALSVENIRLKSELDAVLAYLKAEHEDYISSKSA